jgi:hypothetical protein
VQDEAPDHYTEEPPSEPFDDDPSSRVAAIAPHDETAERYVIGAALTSPTAYADAASIVTADQFYLPRHEAIWHALADFASTDQPHEPVAIMSALRDAGILMKVGGGEYLHTCVAEVANPMHAGYYAGIIHDLALRRKALTELQRGTAQLRSPGTVSDVPDVLARVRDSLTTALDSTSTGPATSWAPVNLEPVFEGHTLDPAPDMLPRSDGVCLLYSGGIHSIAGESESGKTWITLTAAVQLITANMPVVFIDFEDRPERVISRLSALGAPTQAIRDHFTYIRPDRALDPTAHRDLAPLLTHAVLVIIDGITEAMTIHGLDLNSNEDAAKFYGILPRWIADHGPAVVMIDHVTKNEDTRGRYALGAQHKLAGIDAASYTVKVRQPFGRGKKGIATVSVAKDRPGHVREHARGHRIADFTLDDTNGTTIATLDPPEDASLGDDEPWAPTHLMEKISAYVLTNRGASQTAILESVRGKKNHKTLALELLVRRGYIATEKGPRGAIQHVHVRQFPDPIQNTQEDSG